jgi:hypothetical protein
MIKQLALNSNFDYIESYREEFTSENNISIAQVLINFFNTSPKTLVMLMKIRNIIVGFLGMKSLQFEKRIRKMEEADIRIGNSIGILDIYEKGENYIVAGKLDKLLNVKVIYELNKIGFRKYSLRVVTGIYHKTTLLKWYFFMVKPIHKLLVKIYIKKAVNKIK